MPKNVLIAINRVRLKEGNLILIYTIRKWLSGKTLEKTERDSVGMYNINMFLHIPFRQSGNSQTILQNPNFNA